MPWARQWCSWCWTFAAASGVSVDIVPTVRVRLRELALPAIAAVALAFATACSGDESLARGAPRAAASHPPVVMLVFDEFSTTSLLDDRGGVDAVRYPNFAALAREGTWFPYATASLDETGRAMRSLFTGRTTFRFAKPTYAENPRNLFTLLGRRYRLDASEEVTSMCPKRLCPHVRDQTQRSVLHKLATGRPERFNRWLRSVRAQSRPTFYFKHILLPHAPWRYLPSGRHYVDGPTQKRFSWHLQHFNRWLVNQYYQRHLLQVGFTDRLLGKALGRLRATGLYDRSLVVVTADNGEGFGRRGNGHEIGRENAGDIALTPLFIKLPHQTQGLIVRRHVRTIDVLPTIASVAHVGPGRRVQGRSIFGPASRRIPSSTLLVERSGHRVHLSLGTLRRRGAAALRLKVRLFGSGNAPPGLYGVGPYPFMHGTPVSGWPALAPGGTRAALDLPGQYARVHLGSGLLPVKVMGRLTRSGSHTPTDIAIAINDRIAATAPTVAPRRGGTQFFSALVPEGALHEGRNKMKIFAIVRGAGAPGLRPLTP